MGENQSARSVPLNSAPFRPTVELPRPAGQIRPFKSLDILPVRPHAADLVHAGEPGADNELNETLKGQSSGLEALLRLNDYGTHGVVDLVHFSQTEWFQRVRLE